MHIQIVEVCAAVQVPIQGFQYKNFKLRDVAGLQNMVSFLVHEFANEWDHVWPLLELGRYQKTRRGESVELGRG